MRKEPVLSGTVPPFSEAIRIAHIEPHAIFYCLHSHAIVAAAIVFSPGTNFMETPCFRRFNESVKTQPYPLTTIVVSL